MEGFDELNGVDFASVALERARARGIRSATVDLDKDSLSFFHAVFDHTVCLDVIEHVHDPVRLLKECYRVEASGGLLVVTTVKYAT
jgi:ubiquinone/menaquinone biosynthesis C-methylase UbiE